MSRYIDADKIEYELCESTMPKRYRDFCKRVINDEELIPTAVTMCKNCKYFKFKGYITLSNKQFGECDRNIELVREDDFCSFALERIENDEEL